MVTREATGEVDGIKERTCSVCGNVEIEYIEPITYKIIYFSNGGTFATTTLTGTKLHGVPYTITSVEPKREGYDFKGWSMDMSATSSTYEAGDSYTVNAIAEFHAVWRGSGEIKVTLTHIDPSDQELSIEIIPEEIDNCICYEVNIPTYEGGTLKIETGGDAITEVVLSRYVTKTSNTTGTYKITFPRKWTTNSRPTWDNSQCTFMVGTQMYLVRILQADDYASHQGEWEDRDYVYALFDFIDEAFPQKRNIKTDEIMGQMRESYYGKYIYAMKTFYNSSGTYRFVEFGGGYWDIASNTISLGSFGSDVLNAEFSNAFFFHETAHMLSTILGDSQRIHQQYALHQPIYDSVYYDLETRIKTKYAENLIDPIKSTLTHQPNWNEDEEISSILEVAKCKQATVYMFERKILSTFEEQVLDDVASELNAFLAESQNQPCVQSTYNRILGPLLVNKDSLEGDAAIEDVSSEFFALAFSTLAVGSEDKCEAIRTAFPEATRRIEAYVNDQ